MKNSWKTGLIIGALAAALYGCGGGPASGEEQTDDALMTVDVPVSIGAIDAFISNNNCNDPRNVSVACDQALEAQDLYQCVEADPKAACGDGETIVATDRSAGGCFVADNGSTLTICCFVNIGGYTMMSCRFLPYQPVIYI